MKNMLKCIGFTWFCFLIQVIVWAIGIMPAITDGKIDYNGYIEYIPDRIFIFFFISNIVTAAIMLIIYRLRKNQRTEQGLKIKSIIVPLLSVFILAAGINLIMYGAEQDMMIFRNFHGNELDATFHYPDITLRGVRYISGGIPYLGEIMMILNFLIFAPLSEELLCRGIIQNSLRKEFSPLFSVIAAAVMYGSVYFIAGNFILGVCSIISGIIFGLTYEKTSSLGASVTVHGAANIPFLIFTVLPPVTEQMKPVGTVMICVAAVIISVWFIKERPTSAAEGHRGSVKDVIMALFISYNALCIVGYATVLLTGASWKISRALSHSAVEGLWYLALGGRMSFIGFGICFISVCMGIYGAKTGGDKKTRIGYRIFTAASAVMFVIHNIVFVDVLFCE